MQKRKDTPPVPLAFRLKNLGRGLQAAVRTLDPALGRHMAQLPLIGLTHLTRAPRAPVSLAPDGFRPLVFVHGHNGHPGNVLPFKTYLGFKGRARIYAPSMRGSSSLETLAQRLRRFVAQVLEANPDATQVDLVAHSLGGIIARLAVDDPETAARVSTLVTWATPHGGTELARLVARGPIARLRPDSTLVRRLAEQLPWKGPPRLVCFWSPGDLWMVPPESARVEGARNIAMPGYTHYSYLISPRLFERSSEVLADDSR